MGCFYMIEGNSIALNTQDEFELNYVLTQGNTGLSICQCGHSKCKPGHRFGPWVRDFYLIHFIVNGNGKYCVGGKTYSLGKNQAFLIKPGEETYYKANDDCPWEYYWVGFNGIDVKNILYYCGLDKNEYVFSLVQPEEIFQCLSDMNANANGGIGAEFRLLGDLYMLFSFLMNEHRQIIPETEDKKDLLDMLEYIKKNYESDLSLATLAKFANMDKTTVYRLFKKQMAMSPHQYVENFRLHHALELLRNTKMSVLGVALSVGFRDVQSFCRVFKKRFLFTPSQFRACPKLLKDTELYDLLPDV